MPLKVKPLPSVETLREIFSYDPETGNFCRIKKSKFSSHPLGPCGYRELSGHLVTRIGNSSYKVHRLAWKMHTGEEPPAYIDHANGDPADNSWDNLRSCTNGQNMANGKRRSRTLSGAYHSGSKWVASGKDSGKTVYLGTFNTEAEAHAAYKTWHLNHYGEFSVYAPSA